MKLFSPPQEKFLVLQEMEAPRKLLAFSQRKDFLIFRKKETPKNSLYFRKRNFSYISENSEKLSHSKK